MADISDHKIWPQEEKTTRQALKKEKRRDFEQAPSKKDETHKGHGKS